MIQNNRKRWWLLGFSALALVYAALAGLRTVGDPDLGWQLATGRWIVQHHQIPSTDVLSYTAHGQPWIYPVVSQILLYCAYTLGGYSLLSWLGAAACVATIAILLRGSTTAKFLAVIAVPLIAFRTPPRAEMFTEVLFAASLSILWFFHRTGRGPLWALPLLMLVWTNCHLGFIAGLGLCAAYVFLEFDELLLKDRRAAARERLQRAWPWLLATGAATLLNPWGARIFVAVTRQAEILQVHSKWLVEWMRVPLTPTRMAQGLDWRDPKSAMWWLIAAALLSMGVAVWQRRFAAAAILAASVYLVLHSLRFQGPFASIAVIMPGSILASAPEIGWLRHLRDRAQADARELGNVCAAVALVLSLALVGVRSFDLISNRVYLKTTDQFFFFGPGVSWWYPEDAAAFVISQDLPGEIFNDYNVGGFLTWRLSPRYPDYIDGRSVPFGAALFFHSTELLGASLDSEKWAREADQRNISTVIVSVDHDLGGGLPSLDTYCASRNWRPVYLDTRAAVFVRVRPETAERAQRLAISCNAVRFDGPPAGETIRARSERFEYLINSAAILIQFGRNEEALHQLNLAESIFHESGYQHYAKGLALQYQGDEVGAESELRESLRLDRLDVAALALARLYRRQGRPGEAASTLARAAEWSLHPHQLYLELGAAQLAQGDPQRALRSFDRAEAETPYIAEAAGLGASFQHLLAEGRTRAWSRLADMYDAQGMQSQAAEARRHAASASQPSNPGPSADPSQPKDK